MVEKEEREVLDAAATWKLILTRNCKQQVSELVREYPHVKTLIIPYMAVARCGVGGTRVADDILANPGKAIEDCLGAFQDLNLIRNKDGHPVRDVIPRFVGLPRKTAIKDIRERHMHTMLAIEVQVKRVSDILPRCTEAMFRCRAGHFTRHIQGYSTFSTPDACSADGCTLRKLDFIPKRSEFIDTQRILVQEVLGNLLGGEQPKNMNAEITGDLCGKVFPGDRIIINAILRSYQTMKAGQLSPVFKTYLEVNNIEIFEREYEEVNISEEDEAAIIKLAKHPNVLDNVANSIIPSIYGLTDVKRAIALSLFSGKQASDKAGNTKRRDIHVLLCFDPGMAKSQMGKAVARIAPRGLFVSGQSSSKAGLTVTVTKDESDGRWVAEAGAMCLADGGTIVIDELGHLPKSEQSALHESMESQTTSIAKAGLVATLNTRCNCIALMNPKQGRYDMALELVDQLDMNPALLSRFDLIYCKSDIPNEGYDTGVAEKILADDYDGTEETEPVMADGEISIDLLRKFIAYTKKRKNPKLTEEAKAALTQYYVNVRKLASQGKPVPLTARALEGEYRLAIASAKMRMSDVVEKVDADRAISILDASLKGVAIDPKTGTFDADRIGGGMSFQKRDFVTTLMQVIEKLGGKEEQVLQENIIAEMAKINKGDREKVLSALSNLSRQGDLMEPRAGRYRIMR
jgi:replicative DNA helicase Mcm